jgi:release factor glutamine methyltransferase
MLPTPSLSHLSKEDFTRVYEPAEDTFILLDALEADAERLRREKPRLVVEIG